MNNYKIRDSLKMWKEARAQPIIDAGNENKLKPAIKMGRAVQSVCTDIDNLLCLKDEDLLEALSEICTKLEDTVENAQIYEKIGYTISLSDLRAILDDVTENE